MRWNPILIAVAITSCKCTPGTPPASALTAYAEHQQACVAEAGTREQADSCRAQVRATFCGQYPAACNDGGN